MENFSRVMSKVPLHRDWNRVKSYAQIPGPKSAPIIGNLWRFLPVIGKYHKLDRFDLYSSLFEEYGKIVKISNMKVRKDIVILFDPNDIEMCYRNEGIWPIREGLGSIKYFKKHNRPDVFQNNLGFFATQGEEWAKIRNVSNGPFLQPRSVTKYTGVMSDVAQDFIQHLVALERRHPQGEMPANFSNELNKWALESLCTALFNKKLNLFNPNVLPNAAAEKYLNDVLALFEYMYRIDIKPNLSKWFETPTMKKLLIHFNDITEFQIKIIENIMENTKNDIEGKSTHDLTSLEHLLKKDKLLAFNLIFDIIIAGIDTTSRTCAAALYYLSKNQLAQQKLIRECRMNLTQKDTPVTNNILNDMPYLKAVIKETTRLAPIAIAGLRTLPKDMVFSGYHIPKGITLLCPHLYLCKQDVHFPRANDFIPERWLRGSDEYQNKDTHPFVYMPFGFGPRSCLGKRLANLELEVLLSKIFRNFSITWPHEDVKWSMKLFYGIESSLKYHIKSQID